jgi:hypothetical protein
MYPAWGAAARASHRRRLLARLLSVSFLSSVLALLSTQNVARATGADTGSVTVQGLQVTLQLDCPVSCPAPSFSATSAGDIAGVDGTQPYDAVWTSASMSGSMGYTSTCISQAWPGAQVSGSATIQGVQLRYGPSLPLVTSTATVTLTFNGYIGEGAFTPLTQWITITGGPSSISVNNFPGIPGSMALVPSAPVVLCPKGVQTFTANGTFLTLGANP